MTIGKSICVLEVPLQGKVGIYVLVSEVCGPVRTQVDFFGESTFEGNVSIPIQRTQHRVANFREKKSFCSVI